MVPDHLGHQHQIRPIHVATQLRRWFFARTRSSSSCRSVNSAAASRGLRRLPSAHRRCAQRECVYHQGQVVFDDVEHAGAQHLDGHFASVVQHRKVHLGDGSTGNKGRCQTVGTRADKGFPSTFHQSGRFIAGKGRDTVLQPGKLVGDVGRQQVASGRALSPNLTKMGPRCSSARRKRSPRGAFSRRPTDSTRASRLQPGLRRTVQQQAVQAKSQGSQSDGGAKQGAHLQATRCQRRDADAAPASPA